MNHFQMSQTSPYPFNSSTGAPIHAHTRSQPQVQSPFHNQVRHNQQQQQQQARRVHPVPPISTNANPYSNPTSNMVGSANANAMNAVPPPHLRSSAFAYKQYTRPPMHPEQAKRSPQTSPVRANACLPGSGPGFGGDGAQAQMRSVYGHERRGSWTKAEYQPPYSSPFGEPGPGAEASVAAGRNSYPYGPSSNGPYGYHHNMGMGETQTRDQALRQTIPPTALWLQSIYSAPGVGTGTGPTKEARGPSLLEQMSQRGSTINQQQGSSSSFNSHGGPASSIFRRDTAPTQPHPQPALHRHSRSIPSFPPGPASTSAPKTTPYTSPMIAHAQTTPGSNMPARSPPQPVYQPPAGGAPIMGRSRSHTQSSLTTSGASLNIGMTPDVPSTAAPTVPGSGRRPLPTPGAMNGVPNRPKPRPMSMPPQERNSIPMPTSSFPQRYSPPAQHPLPQAQTQMHSSGTDTPVTMIGPPPYEPGSRQVPSPGPPVPYSMAISDMKLPQVDQRAAGNTTIKRRALPNPVAAVGPVQNANAAAVGENTIPRTTNINFGVGPLTGSPEKNAGALPSPPTGMTVQNQSQEKSEGQQKSPQRRALPQPNIRSQEPTKQFKANAPNGARELGRRGTISVSQLISRLNGSGGGEGGGGVEDGRKTPPNANVPVSLPSSPSKSGPRAPLTFPSFRPRKEEAAPVVGPPSSSTTVKQVPSNSTAVPAPSIQQQSSTTSTTSGSSGGNAQGSTKMSLRSISTSTTDTSAGEEEYMSAPEADDSPLISRSQLPQAEALRSEVSTPGLPSAQYGIKDLPKRRLIGDVVNGGKVEGSPQYGIRDLPTRMERERQQSKLASSQLASSSNEKIDNGKHGTKSDLNGTPTGAEKSPQYGIRDLPLRTKSVVERRRAWERAESGMHEPTGARSSAPSAPPSSSSHSRQRSQSSSPTKRSPPSVQPSTLTSIVEGLGLSQLTQLRKQVGPVIPVAPSPQPQTPKQTQKGPMPAVQHPKPGRMERTPSWTLQGADLEEKLRKESEEKEKEEVEKGCEDVESEIVRMAMSGEGKTSMALKFAAMGLGNEGGGNGQAQVPPPTPPHVRSPFQRHNRSQSNTPAAGSATPFSPSTRPLSSYTSPQANPLPPVVQPSKVEGRDTSNVVSSATSSSRPPSGAGHAHTKSYPFTPRVTPRRDIKLDLSLDDAPPEPVAAVRRTPSPARSHRSTPSVPIIRASEECTRPLQRHNQQRQQQQNQPPVPMISLPDDDPPSAPVSKSSPRSQSKSQPPIPIINVPDSPPTQPSMPPVPVINVPDSTPTITTSPPSSSTSVPQINISISVTGDKDGPRQTVASVPMIIEDMANAPSPAIAVTGAGGNGKSQTGRPTPSHTSSNFSTSSTSSSTSSTSSTTTAGANAKGRGGRGGGLSCGGCHQSIIGRIVSAMNLRWHPACFKCCVCGEHLEHVSSYEHDGKPYCHLDYHEIFAPQCYSCKTPIIDERFITLDDPALGKRTYHEQHFFCAECGDPFLAPSSSSLLSRKQKDIPSGGGARESINIKGDGAFDVALDADGEEVGFTVFKGHPYCEACHVRLRAPKCKGCKRSIRDGDNAVEALGGKWCYECFVCEGCKEPFEEPSFFQRDKKPFCERCFSIIIRNEV